MKTLRRSFLASALALGVAGCSGPREFVKPNCPEVSLHPSRVVMGFGETRTFVASEGNGKYKFSLTPEGSGELKELASNAVEYTPRQRADTPSPNRMPYSQLYVFSCDGTSKAVSDIYVGR